jgi:GMP synthase-like glutamine amidotransferase
MKLGLLEADHVGERFVSVAGGYPAMFDALLRPHVAGLTWSRFDACHGELPARVDECDAWICTGSRASAYGSDAWIAALAGFLVRLRDAGAPFAGICFGHQVLARALGGEVARAPGGWGVGVREMTILRREPWMDPPLERCRLPHMHADQVTRLPDGAVHLARSAHCEIAMFRAGDAMLGIEGHPEFPSAYSEALLRDRVERIGRERVEDALSTLATPSDAPIVARWIARFLARDS